METLNYKVLSETGYNGYILKDAPVKVMQFGEGNFLRAFVDWIIWNMKRKGLSFCLPEEPGMKKSMSR